MKRLQVPRKSLRESAASLPALAILAALSGSALAATDIEAPCPEASSSSDVLHSFIARDASAAIAQTIDATETITSKRLADNALSQSATDAEESAVDDSETEETANPALTSRLPGVSVNDLPGFRRHMYRTDI